MRAAIGVVLWGMLTLAACTTPRPLDRATITDPRWQGVLDEYESTVRAASQQSTRKWHHGWLGNATVLNQGPPHMGLCWQWRDELDQALTPVLSRQGLVAMGIHARRGTRMEHNALLLYDPTRLTQSQILSVATPSQDSDPAALVLDPWFTGTAAIYSVAEWSRLATDAHPVGTDLRPFPVGQLAVPAKSDVSPAW